MVDASRRLATAVGIWLLIVVATGDVAVGQVPATPPATPSSAPASASPPDALGRETPRGSVLGFLSAARKGANELAAQYLSTQLKGEPAATLAHQLYVVLDARLPPRLTELSDTPEGSRRNPLRPHEETVGIVSGPDGPVDIIVERMPGGDARPIWLFSSRTLRAIPALYDEVTFGLGEQALPRVVTGTKLAGVRVVEWLILLIALPFFYALTVALDRLLRPVVAGLWRRAAGESTRFSRQVLPVPCRLLLVAVAMRWLLAVLPLSLMVRQIGSSLATLITIGAIVWLMILLSGEVEAYVTHHFPRASGSAAQALVRVLRRAVDLLVILVGLLATLRHFGIDPTPALAGLGVGGIAVALAAQKTLENVIAGASLIFDQAVRVGDFLKMGELSGTVEQIGLRSTRIRTLDRTVIIVPNSQIANASLETISARDKFWFHHVVGLRYETTPDQIRAIIDRIQSLLAGHPLVDRDAVRVRFLRLGAFSLDVDVFAYVQASSWNHFLEVQEALLFSITDIVAGIGAEIAFPSQTMYVDQGSQVVRNRPIDEDRV